MRRAHLLATVALVGSGLMSGPPSAAGQAPFEGEVRQLVTFSFLPGQSAEAIGIYRDEVLALYRQDVAMRSFRAFREVESPVPLDLVVVSSFEGMAGMDESNDSLRAIAGREGKSIGALYGAIGAHSASHHDQFVRMLPSLGVGDPTDSPLVAFVWYRVAPKDARAFEQATLEAVSFERDKNIHSSTGRFLVADDWSYLRTFGFESLGQYESFWTAWEAVAARRAMDRLIVGTRQVILAPVPALSVR